MKGIILDDNGEFLISNNSLHVDNVDSQITEHVLKAYPGEFKEAPTLGAFVQDMLAGSFDPFWKSKTVNMLKSQKINVKKIEINNNKISIEL